jgi:hypothetical protein
MQIDQGSGDYLFYLYSLWIGTSPTSAYFLNHYTERHLSYILQFFLS